MQKKASRFQRICAQARALCGELPVNDREKPARLHRFVHFWVLVWRSFVRNRCPVRASALAYGTLLALIPMLAVVMSISSGLLKKEGEAGIQKFIEKFVASVSGAGSESTTAPAQSDTDTNKSAETATAPNQPEQIAK